MVSELASKIALMAPGTAVPAGFGGVGQAGERAGTADRSNIRSASSMGPGQPGKAPTVTPSGWKRARQRRFASHGAAQQVPAGVADRVAGS